MRGLVFVLIVVATVIGCRPARAGEAAAVAVPVADRGVFADLNPRVRIAVPSWLAGGPLLRVKVRRPQVELLYSGGSAVGFVTSAVSATSTIDTGVEVQDLRGNDADGDGIPDALDILLGAKKAALNAAVYRNRYHRLRYPGGDVPRGEGVCTDVIIRALRNAGIDLQRELQQDIRRARRAYRMVRRPDRNIDHRRVRTLLPYFRRHWRSLSPVPSDSWLPGDIVLLNTMGDARPDHIGVVSDRRGPSRRPLIINNWTVGHRTAEMDLLSFVPVTHRFRIPGQPLRVDQQQRGLEGLLRRNDLQLAPQHRQALVVTAPLWSSARASLRRYVRTASGAWQPVGRTVPVQLGAAGLGAGRGLHGTEEKIGRKSPTKREGDRRSPAGVFALGTAFGATSRRPSAPGGWPWRSVDAHDRFVDDAASPHYNSWQRVSEGRRPAWSSAEALAQYRLALVIEHNMRPVKRGAGSAIFLHVSDPHEAPTLGCTALAEIELQRILRWLRPAAAPVLVQLAGTMF